MPRFGQRFHALRQADGVSLRGVVHAQVVADLADDDVARVEADAHAERHAVLHAHVVGVLAHGIAQMQRRVAGAMRVVLVRDRRAEQRHDAVAGVLVHRAFEAMHALGEDREEALEDLVPLFRIELLGQLHRALDVGEQHGDLLALAFEGGLGLQDFVGEVFGGVGAGIRRISNFEFRISNFRQGGATLVAELRGWTQLRSAAGADRPDWRGTASQNLAPGRLSCPHVGQVWVTGFALEGVPPSDRASVATAARGPGAGC